MLHGLLQFVVDLFLHFLLLLQNESEYVVALVAVEGQRLPHLLGLVLVVETLVLPLFGRDGDGDDDVTSNLMLYCHGLPQVK